MSTKAPRREYDQKRIEFIGLRLTEGERAELTRMAKAEGLSMSAYIRKHLLRESGSINRPKAKA